MRPCPCAGTNEACYFCGGKGFVTDAARSAPRPRATSQNRPKKSAQQKSARPKNTVVVAANFVPRPKVHTEVREAREGPKSQCPGCRVWMTKRTFKEHLSACPRTFLYETCSSCSKRILRSKIRAHAKSCANRLLSKRPATPPRLKSPSTAQDQKQSRQRCPRCGASVNVARMEKHLRKVHGMPIVEVGSVSVVAAVRTGRRIVVGRTLPVKKALPREPSKPVASNKPPVASNKPRAKGVKKRNDVFDLPSKLLQYGGAFDSNRRRH